MRKVITYGTFDLFHQGHYNLLKRARELGDYLIVGVTTEHFDEERGKLNIVDTIMQRVENVRKSGFADQIIIEDHEGQKIEDIQKLGVDIFTVGSDWVGIFDYLNAYCKVVYLKRTPDISSTMLREQKRTILSMGVVGTGRIAPRFLAEMKYVSGVYAKGVYNPHAESAERFAAQYEVEGFSGSYEDFLDQIDAIYVASPHETHYDYTKRALLKGKHVLCEKPLAFSRAEAEELFSLANEHHAVLMEGIKTAYCPGFAQMIHVVKSGKIGEVRDVEACFSRLTKTGVRELVDSDYGGAFLEFGSYTILPIIKLLGRSYRDVQIDSILADNGIDAYTKVSLRYDNSLALSKTGVAVKSEGQLLIAGTKGYILAESPWWLTKKFQVRFEDPSIIENYEPKFMGDGLRYEVSEFVAKIQGHAGQSFKLTPEESIAMADIVERFMKKRRREKDEIRQRNKQIAIDIWAHRGCSCSYPENTLPAFEAACKLPGIAGIELDVQMSRDGQIVVFHDETTDRLMNREGYVKDFTMDELKLLNFREWKKEEEICIPTLEEVLQLVKPYSKANGTRINIELKNSRISYAGMEEKVLELVEKHGMNPWIVYSSFSPESVRKIKKLNPANQTGILQADMKDCQNFSMEHEVDALHPCLDTVSAGCENSKNLPIRAWNTSEPFYGQLQAKPVFDLARLKERGVTDLITNLPEQYLEHKGESSFGDI